MQYKPCDEVHTVLFMAADLQPRILRADYTARVAMVFLRTAAVLFCQVGLNLPWIIRGGSRS